MRALPINVYKNENSGDCSNNGISSRYSRVLLVCEDGPIYVDTNNPPKNLVKLVKRTIFGIEYMHLEPCECAEGNGYMFGGCYCSSSDYRFKRISDYPLPLHDRQE